MNDGLSQLIDAAEKQHEDISHVSAQLDILNHSVYVQNEYLMWMTVSLMLIAALMMFLVGYILTRR